PALAVRVAAGAAAPPRPRGAPPRRAGGAGAVTGALVEDEAGRVAIARAVRSVAVLGIKDADEPDAAAYSIARLLAETGVRVIGVNPNVRSALGHPTLASLSELRERVDVVDVFRRSEHIPGHADELLALPPELRPDVVWLQSGIRNDAA